jgi:hypothetical protein
VNDRADRAIDEQVARSTPITSIATTAYGGIGADRCSRLSRHLIGGALVGGREIEHVPASPAARRLHSCAAQIRFQYCKLNNNEMMPKAMIPAAIDPITNVEFIFISPSSSWGLIHADD